MHGDWWRSHPLVFAPQGIIYDLMAEQQDSYETGRSLIVSWRVGGHYTGGTESHLFRFEILRFNAPWLQGPSF